MDTLHSKNQKQEKMSDPNKPICPRGTILAEDCIGKVHSVAYPKSGICTQQVSGSITYNGCICKDKFKVHIRPGIKVDKPAYCNGTSYENETYYAA